MKIDKPAILGGQLVFDKLVPIVKPPLYKYTRQDLLHKIKEILDSGMVTNHIYVAELERKLAKYLQVKEAVGLASCTSGLILSLQLLDLRNKEVLLPSFTFSATAHAAYWNNCKIVFVDCDRETFNISIKDLEQKISDEVAGIIGVHIFGNPCEIDALERIARERNIKLIFDSAHALGAQYEGRKIGNFGDAEVFSCSPTKLFITIEGGVVSTNNPDLAEKLAVAGNYGSYPDYTCEIPGLSARMTEINAVLGLEMLNDIDEMVANRNRYAGLYRTYLSEIPGIKFQETTKNSVCTYKDFAIVIDSDEFGIDRDLLYDVLNKENIISRKYFSPAVHQLKAYSNSKSELSNTNFLSKNVLCLPIYSYMDKKLIENVCLAIQRIHQFASMVRAKV